jgi:hypothetical protein
MSLQECRKLSAAQSTAVVDGLKRLMQRRREALKAECSALHSQGRRAWHSLVNMCMLLDDFCNFCTKDFASDTQTREVRVCIVVVVFHSRLYLLYYTSTEG